MAIKTKSTIHGFDVIIQFPKNKTSFILSLFLLLFLLGPIYTQMWGLYIILSLPIFIISHVLLFKLFGSWRIRKEFSKLTITTGAFYVQFIIQIDINSISEIEIHPATRLNNNNNDYKAIKMSTDTIEVLPCFLVTVFPGNNTKKLDFEGYYELGAMMNPNDLIELSTYLRSNITLTNQSA